MKLDTVAQTFKDLGARALSAVRGPSRDDLVTELDALRANEPGYIDIMIPLAPLTGLCAACTAAHRQETERRMRYASHGARVAALEGMLLRCTSGGPDERDEAGHALAALRAELNRMAGEHDRRCQHWERGIEHDRRGLPVRAWSTVEGLNDATRDLAAVRRAAGELVYRTTDEILTGVPELRRRASEIMARPLERDVPLAGALSAPPRLPAGSEAERAGLVPGGSNVLGGTVRFTRRDSA